MIRKSEKIGEPQGRGKNVAMTGDIWATSYSMVAIPSAAGVLCRYGVALPPTIRAAGNVVSALCRLKNVIDTPQPIGAASP